MLLVAQGSARIVGLPEYKAVITTLGWITLITIVGTVVFILVATMIWRSQMKHHHGVSREEFIEAFVGENIPPEIAATVHGYYENKVRIQGFGVAPEDSEILGLPEDVDEDSRVLLEKLGLKVPPRQVLPQWGSPIRTLRDLVMWLDWVRQNQPS